MGKEQEYKSNNLRVLKDQTFLRRVEMMYYISEVRVFSYRDLQFEFGISSRMVKKDLDSLETVFHVPLIRIKGKKTTVEKFWSATQPKLPFGICLRLVALRNRLNRLENEEEGVELIEYVVRKYGISTVL